MKSTLIRHVEISNFRSIKGTIFAPMDAKVVLVHGENGTGKTSLLSAIELALTGRVISLQKADSQYAAQLLHRSPGTKPVEMGSVTVETVGLPNGNTFRTNLTSNGVHALATLPSDAAAFFTERCYLPQSLLGQLLQIYQDSDSAPSSPLSRFVTELLGLDRLDSIESGLTPVGDIRNLRKTTDRYGEIEYEKAQLERNLTEHRRVRDAAHKALNDALIELNTARVTLGANDQIDESKLDDTAQELETTPEEEALSKVHDQRRRLEAIAREANRDDEANAEEDEEALAAAHRQASEQLHLWQQQFAAPLRDLRAHIASELPNTDDTQIPPQEYQRITLSSLREKRRQAEERSARAAQDIKRQGEISNELDVAHRNLQTVDSEIGRIAENSGALGAALAELSSFISTDICPVCDRDFRDERKGSLADHLNHKIRTLTGSAERLLGLGRNRATQQEQINRLNRENAQIQSRALTLQESIDLDRTASACEVLISDLERLAPAMTEGWMLGQTESATRRALTNYQSRNLARTAAMNALGEFARELEQHAPKHLETPQHVVARLLTSIESRAHTLNLRLTARSKARDSLHRSNLQLARRKDVDARIAADELKQRKVDDALKRAARIRSDAQTIRSRVEAVRSRIISQEFNDRLNRLWRDLFIRLAPNEPYVPAFRIPTESTHRLQPKLITTIRSGGSGGTPGAMLSAGNLNTAALTLFIALHLTVSERLPWLILDDPVQSMDDLHISNFAALLRTISKQHRRQIIVAVHDRQLFEYLKLELSPAFEGDNLRTLQLSRSPGADTLCLAERRSFRPETALRFVA